MSNIDYNLEKRTYTLFVNSNDKISGNHNNASFDIHWNDFLPLDFDMYKVIFSFQTTGGNYKDGTYNTVPYVFSTAKVHMNFQGRSYTYDTALKSQSAALGFIQRDIQTTTTASNTLSCFYLQNPPKCIVRPNTNVLTVSVYNSFINNTLLSDTNAAGTALLGDMTPWSMVLEFIPIGDSKRTPSKESLFGF